MAASIIKKIRSSLHQIKYGNHWRVLTDYERSLARMSLSELAHELERTQVRNETTNTIIVEHTLAVRLARIQSRASWWSGWLGFAGAMLAAALTFFLGQWSAYEAQRLDCTQVHKVVQFSTQTTGTSPSVERHAKPTEATAKP